MMSFSALSATARRRIVPLMSRQTQQKRNMALGGHHGPPPEWTGIDKVVRGYFPEDYQLAIAILGGYFGLVTLYKIKSAVSGKKPEPVVPVAAPAAPSSVSSTGAIPSVDSDDFAKYLETDSFLKLLENEKELSAALA